jgi:hypothetical protein
VSCFELTVTHHLAGEGRAAKGLVGTYGNVQSDLARSGYPPSSDPCRLPTVNLAWTSGFSWRIPVLAEGNAARRAGGQVEIPDTAYWYVPWSVMPSSLEAVAAREAQILESADMTRSSAWMHWLVSRLQAHSPPSTVGDRTADSVIANHGPGPPCSDPYFLIHTDRGSRQTGGQAFVAVRPGRRAPLI